MADRGRDLKFSILSDLSQFDTDRPARQLEDLGDAATAAGKAVDKMSDTVDRTDLDKLGKEAKDTATKVDSAFDKISASSKANLRKVGDDAKVGMREAGEATTTFKDEARSNLSEVASSFQGDMTSAVDLVQGTLGGVVQDLGPLGLALGAAGAAGLGIIASSIQAAKERVAELTASFLDLRKQGIDPAADSAAHLVDELDAASLSQFKRDADELGISYQLLQAAFDGNTEAIKTARKAIEDYNNANAGGNPFTGEQADLHERLSQKLNDTEKAYRNAADASAFLGSTQAGTTISTEAVTRAIEEHANALDSFVDPANVYTQLLADKKAKEQESAQATADATTNQKDSWQDYAKSVDVSVGEYLASLEKQVTAQEQWAGNLQKLAKRGVDEGVLAELEKMGPEGAPLVAKLTTASDAELSKMVALYGRQGAAAGQSVASNLVAQSGDVSASARELHQKASAELAKSITIPVNLGDLTNEVRLALAEAQDYARRHPVYASVKNTAPGHTRDVP